MVSHTSVTSHIPEIVLLALDMELSEDSIRFMMSIYNIVFVKKLREEIVTLATRHCYGFEVNHPSQAQHTCLMWTEFEHLDMYLEEALETVDREEARKKWDNEMTRMDKMSYLFLAHHTIQNHLNLFFF
jgi:hypothetical protein